MWFFLCDELNYLQFSIFLKKKKQTNKQTNKSLDGSKDWRAQALFFHLPITKKTVKHSTYVVGKKVGIRTAAVYVLGATESVPVGKGRPMEILITETTLVARRNICRVYIEDRGLINGRGIRKSFAFCMPGPDVACQIIVEGFLFAVETTLCV